MDLSSLAIFSRWVFSLVLYSGLVIVGVTIAYALLKRVARAAKIAAEEKARKEREAAEEARRRAQFSQSKYAESTGNTYETTMSDDGAQGEYDLSLELQKFDPNGMLLFNLYVPRPNGTTSEVDAVFVNATGVYVFENKNYSGWIFGSRGDRTWTQTFPNGSHYTFPNPIRQNEGHIKALQAYLGLDRNAFVSVVVFSDYCEFKKVDGGDVPVMHTEDVFRTLARIRGSRDLLLPPDTMAAIYEKLQACTRADDATKHAHVDRIQKRWKPGGDSPFTPKAPAVTPATITPEDATATPVAVGTDPSSPRPNAEGTPPS